MAKFRPVALVLALLFAASPVADVVCEIDCDQPRKPASCHESATSSDGPGMRGSEQHACDRLHAADTPAVVASSAGRGSFASLVATEAPVPAEASPGRAHLTSTSRHGPPGPDGRSLSAPVTVLRI